MKKTLALILMLVLSAFTFASCAKKDKAATTTAAPGTTPSTTAAPTGSSTTAALTEPEAIESTHVHTPESEYTVLTPASCVSPGHEAILCIDCGQEIPGTSREIPIDPDGHSITVWEVTEEATILNPVGTKTGHCSLCNRDFEKNFDVEIKIFDASASNASSQGGPVTMLSAGEEYFYPTEEHPDGQDLLFEFSYLFNETLDNTVGDTDLSFYVGTSSASQSLMIFSLSLRDSPSDTWLRGGAKVKGHFQTVYQSGDLIYPTAAQLAENPDLEFPGLGEYGWHRIGVRVHQDAEIAGNEVKYTLTTTLYVDGAKVLAFRNEPAKQKAKDFYLYKAEIEDGNLVYSEGTVTAGQTKEFNFPGATQPACLVFADLSVTCGDDFVQKVEKNASPAPAQYEVAAGVNVDATVYYQLKAD